MTIDDLIARVTKIEEKLEKPKKKDSWDKLSILGSIVTPLMIGVATVMISSSQKVAADRIAEAQLKVAQTNSRIEQGKLVPDVMDALLNDSDPKRQALAIRTVREALPDIGGKVLEAAISVDPSIENALLGNNLSAEISFGFNSEESDVPDDALFDTTPTLTLKLYEDCVFLGWGQLDGPNCNEKHSISSDTISIKRQVSETVDDISIRQTIQFSDFRGETATFFKNLENPQYTLYADFHVRTPLNSSTTAFLQRLGSSNDINKITDHESAAHCLYKITSEQKTAVEAGEYGDYIYTFFSMPASLRLLSAGKPIDALHGYLASLWVYDEQVDSIYNIEFRPVNKYPVTEDCVESFVEEQ